MSAPPATVLPTADGPAAAVTSGQKRRLDDPADPHTAEAEAAAKQLRPDPAGAAAGAAFLNAALLSGGLCGLPGAVAPVCQPPILGAAATSTPQSAAAFVAGAAAVTQALFQQQQRGAAAGGVAGSAQGDGGAAGGAGAPGGVGDSTAAVGASSGDRNSTAGASGEGVSDVLAADIARAAAAAAAAISARQSNANTAAKAFQLALKTAEMLQGGTGSAGATSQSATPAAGPELNTQTRHARKVYVGNLPVPVTQVEVQQYFNELLDSLLPNKVPGQTIIHVYVNGARRFAFLEHRSIEEANFTIGLDGISWRNCCLSLRRPQDYNPTLAEQQYQERGLQIALPPLVMNFLRKAAPAHEPGRYWLIYKTNKERSRQGSFTGFAVPPPSAAANPAAAPHSALIAGALGIVSTTVPDSPHKIFIGGLPHSITEPACKQLLEAFGQLRALHVVKDPQRGDCKGFAFCEYLDPNVTDVAVAGLNNMRIGDRVLQVRRAMPHGHMKGSTPENATPSPPPMPSIVGTLSRVIAIHNMLPPLPLVPKLLRDAVATEARIRAAAYGEVVCVDVQEALATQAAAKGEGVPVLVEFKDVDTAIQAMSGIQGSTYDGRLLSVVFSEPSAAMKKAAVMRIVMEAGGASSPFPMKQTPSPVSGSDTAEATSAESKTAVSTGTSGLKQEHAEHTIERQAPTMGNQEHQQAPLVKQQQEQLQKAEPHDPRGPSAAEGAAKEECSTEVPTSSVEDKSTFEVADAAKAPSRAKDVNAGVQQADSVSPAPRAQGNVTETSTALPACGAGTQRSAASSMKEQGEMVSLISCPSAVTKSGTSEASGEDGKQTGADALSQRTDDKAVNHVDGSSQ